MQRANNTNDDDDDAFDERGLLRDGRKYRVRMSMRDAMLARDQQRPPVLHDGRGGPVGRRPGFIMSRTPVGDARQQAYLDYERDLVNAHRRDQNPPTGAGSVDPIGAQEGDLCTVRNAEFPDDQGAPGHMRMLKGRLVCVPDRQRQQARSSLPDLERAQSGREAAYRTYDEQIRDAWKAS
jgi:hypothetical protein